MMNPGDHKIPMPDTAPKLIVVGHYDTIASVEFSTDGRYVVSRSSDGTTIVWNVETGQIERLLTRDEEEKGFALLEDRRFIKAEVKFDRALARRTLKRVGWRPLQVSPDGKLIADFVTGREDRSLFIVVGDTRIGRILHQTLYRNEDHLSYTDRLMFSKDGELLGATDDEEEGVLLWNLRTRETRRVLKGQPVQLFNVSFLPEYRLVAVSTDGSQMWDVETERLLHADTEKFDYFSHPVPWDMYRTSLSFSSDGSRSVLGIGQGIVAVREWAASRTLLWQTQSQHVYARSTRFSYKRLEAIALSPDDHTLATGGCDHLVRLWDARTGALLHTLGRSIIVIEALAFAPDGKCLTALSDDGIARVWSLDEARLIRQEAHGLPPPSWEISPIWDTAAKLWNADRSALSPNVEIPEGAEIVAISPDGSLLACKHQDDRISVWNRSSQSFSAALPETYPTAQVAFSPDNRFLAVNIHPLHLFDLNAGGICQDLAPDALQFVFSPDGRTLVAEHAKSILSVWDVRKARSKRVLKSPHIGAYGIPVLALSPDGRMLALAPAYDKGIWLQPLGRKRKARFLSGHTTNVCTITFSPDGTQVATGAVDGTVMLWDVATAALRATFLALPDGEWVIYTPGGRYVASLGADPYLRWRVGDDLLPAQSYAQEWNILRHL